MRLKLALYNVEWMKELFYSDGSPKRADQGSKEERRAGGPSLELARPKKIQADNNNSEADA